MQEYPGNSFRQSEPESEIAPVKKVEKVVEGEVIIRKKPLGKRFASLFVGGDARTVGQYILFDVLLPAMKDTIADVASQGVERMLFGEARSTSRRTGTRPGTGTGTHVSYNRSFQSPNQTPSYGRPDPRYNSERTHRVRNAPDLDEIILPTRTEAEGVLDQLFTLIDKYNSVSVADLFEMLGVTGTWTDDKWGWTDIRGARAVRVRSGYLLDLPRPEPLD